MGGIYTSTRHTPKRVQVKGSQSPGVGGTLVPLAPFNGNFSWRDTQTTTSYRSRGRRGDEEFIPANTGEFVTNLRETGQLGGSIKYDYGHEFSTKKITRDGGFQNGNPMDCWNFSFGSPSRFTRISHPHTDNRYLHNGNWRLCEGDPDPSWFITSNDVVSGKQAISLASPTRPVANLSTLIGETLSSPILLLPGARLLQGRTRDILKSVPGLSRDIGSEYLNVVFGWLPLIQDIRKIITACLDANAIIASYTKDSGLLSRRHYKLPILDTTLLFQGSDVSPGNATYSEAYKADGTLLGSGSGGFTANVSSAGMVVSVSARQSRWFTGGFTYYVPEGGGAFQDLSRFEALAAKLFGTRLTPEVLWEIAPWSWLIDWIAGIQAHLSVFSQLDADGLVLRYGYLTIRDQVTVSTLFDVSALNGAELTYKRSAFTRIVYDGKRRIKSTPFGFGLSPSAFTDRQWTILAALGMTRGPRTLR